MMNRIMKISKKEWCKEKILDTTCFSLYDAKGV